MKVTKQNISEGSGNRVYLLDEIRGFAIICMVIYHALFMLKSQFGVNVPVFFESWFDIIRDFFAGMFILISGIMCRYSHDNVRRGAVCFLIGMGITFVTPFFMDNYISFGILHMLGIAMILYGIFSNTFEKIPPLIGFVISAALVVYTWNTEFGFMGFGSFLRWDIPKAANDTGVLFPLGIVSDSYTSGDYYPLLPWFFVFLAGSYMGQWFRNGSMPRVFYNSHCRWLASVGRVTLWIYVIHAPVLLGIFSLIFR